MFLTCGQKQDTAEDDAPVHGGHHEKLYKGSRGLEQSGETQEESKNFSRAPGTHHAKLDKGSKRLEQPAKEQEVLVSAGHHEQSDYDSNSWKEDGFRRSLRRTRQALGSLEQPRKMLGTARKALKHFFYSWRTNRV